LAVDIDLCMRHEKHPLKYYFNTLIKYGQTYFEQQSKNDETVFLQFHNAFRVPQPSHSLVRLDVYLAGVFKVVQNRSVGCPEDFFRKRAPDFR